MKKSTLGLTSIITVVGMATGFQIASNAMPHTVNNDQNVGTVPVSTPRPTITITATPTITAAPVEVVEEVNGDTAVGVPVDSGGSYVAPPAEQPVVSAPVVEQPAQQPVAPPATNTGASGY